VRSIVFFALFLIVGLRWAPVWADIYIWIDEEGVRHISNVQAPPQAKLLLRTAETPPQTDDHQARQAAEQQRELEREQAEIREREEQLARREAELERRIEAAERDVEAAQNRIEAAEARHEREKSPAIAYSHVIRTYRYGHYRNKRHLHGDRHDRFKRHRYRPTQRYGLSIAGRPLRLGSTVITFRSGRHDYRKHSRHGMGLSGPRRHAGRPPNFHGHPRRHH